MAREDSVVLILDEDAGSAREVQRFLKVGAVAFRVSYATTVQDAVEQLRSAPPDIVLSDSGFVSLPDYQQVRVLLDKTKTPFVLLSGSASNKDLQKQAEQTGAADYLVKNKVNLFGLQKVINSVLKVRDRNVDTSRALQEYAARQEILMQTINQMAEGVLIIGKDNIIRFANHPAYRIVGQENTPKDISGILLYRDIESREVIEWKGNRKHKLEIRISPIDWHGEPCNLIILHELKNEEREKNLLVLDVMAGLLDHISASILLIKNGQIVFANKFAAAKLRLSQKALATKKLTDIFGSEEMLLPADSLTDFMVERSLSGRVQLGDGSSFPALYIVRHLSVEGALYQLMSFEIQELSSTKEIPHQRSDERKFTTDDVLTLASHDLREPVRTILNYVQLISENLVKAKYDEALQYAEIAQQAAGRMDALLTDLKVYIALNDYAFTPDKVNMKQLAAEVLKSLKQKIDESGATVQVADLPEVYADRELMKKLLFYLVDNALKFHKKNKPLVDIAFDKFEGELIFCVRDNGVGIPKKYHTKIFELFERLNRVDEYPGNGLGLAICKKIVELHGGKIWLESAPGGGSGFFFSV